MASSRDPKLKQHRIAENIKSLNEQELGVKYLRADFIMTLSTGVGIAIVVVMAIVTFACMWFKQPIPLYYVFGGAPVVICFVLYQVYHGVAERAQQKLRFAFEEVQQGKVLARDKKEGGKGYNEWWIQIRGYNRRNQLRTNWRKVDAGGWEDGTYAVGTYHDFREPAA